MAIGSRIGIHLLPGQIRAVRMGVGSGAPQAFEVDWHPDATAQAVAAIRERLGRARGVAVAVDVALMYVKRVTLPPLPLAARRRILALEPDRFFPVRGEALAVGLADEENLAFACLLDEFDGWVSAFEALGPLSHVEPGPYALARALSRGRISTSTILTQSARGATTVTSIAGGTVRDVRKMRTVPGQGDLPSIDGPLFVAGSRGRADTDGTPLPRIDGVTGDHLTAWGAALAVPAGADAPFVTERLARRAHRRASRRLATAVTIFVAAAAFSLATVGTFRARTLARVEADVASLTERAQSVIALRDEAAALEQELTRLTNLASQRTDPLAALLTLSRILPADAYLRSIQASDGEWRVDGYAADAASLIPLLESSPAFDGAQFLRATNRVRIGRRDLEDFTLAFRYVAAR